MGKSMKASTKVLYIAGGRNVLGRAPGRKIFSILDSWITMGYQVRAIFGGDFKGGVGSVPGGGFGNSAYYQKWYRRVSVLDPFIRTYSERRDIQHHNIILESLEALCSEFQPDLIWERSCRLHCPGLEMSKRLSIPYVLEWKDHLVDYKFSFFRGKALSMERRKNQEADYIIVESGVLRDQLEREGVNGRKIIVAHNAVQADEFTRDKQKGSRVRNDFDVDDETILVGYLGSYAFYHDTARLVLALDIIRKRDGGRKIKILMVGAGKEYPHTRRLAEKLGLLDSILIIKPGVPQDEVPGILSALDIAVLPGSTDIIAPIKIQEYMAAELPAIVPDYACNREVIDVGINGVLFEPKNEEDLSDKIELLASDMEMRKRIGREARKKILDHFTWEKTWGAALEEVLRRIDK
jgi:glycosyltransferase involved in cell wall biosynthesis